MTRSAARRFIPVMLVALTYVAVGCGGTGTQGDAEQSRVAASADDQDSGGGAAGAPFDADGNDTAVGAPITIPDFQIVGADFEQQRPFIEDEFRRACGGELCVEVVAVPDTESGGVPCEITAVPSGMAERRSTVVFEVSEPCGGSPPDDGTPPPNDGDSESSSEAPDTGESADADPDAS